jgi:hypothetical protein
MTPPTWEPWTWRWTYESTKYSIEQPKNTEKSTVYRYLGKAQESIWFIIFIIILLSGRKRIRLFGCKPVLLADVGWGILSPSLDSQEAFTSMEKLWYLFGGDGVRSTARDQLSRRESWGMGATEESAQTPAMCILSPPTGESSGHQSSTVDAMHKHFHPSSRTSSRHWTPHHQPRALLQ